MNVKKAGLLFATGFVCALCFFRICGAQQPASTISAPVNEPAVGQEVGDALHELPEPYKHWKAHSGTAPQCVATVHVDARAGDPAFTVSCLVVRCDGFLLVPRSAFDRLKVKGATGSVSVTGAEGETISAPIPIVGGRNAPADGRYPDYGLLKITNHHIRCLGLLSASVVQKDLTVDIVFATDDAGKPGICVPHSYTATVDRVPEGSEHASPHAEHFMLADVRPEGKSSNTVDPSDAAAIPIGAVVVDHESGAAIGMVTQSGAQPRFATLAQFSRIYNEVPVAPSRSSIAWHHEKTQVLPPGMVFIPGGPVKLHGRDVVPDYVDNFGTDVVCMPDFECDILPVTNQQYRDWLAGPGAETLWPAGWPITEINQPTRRGDLPVEAAPGTSAALYAYDHDKRLLTQAEWQRAALIYTLPPEVTAKTNSFLMANKYLQSRVFEIMQQRAALAEIERQNGHGSQSSLEAAYNLIHAPLPPDVIGDFRKLQDLANDLAPAGGVAGEVHTVGNYPGDVSVFGVRDVVSNAVELLIPVGNQEFKGAEKVYGAHSDAYTSFMEINERGEDVNHLFVEITPTAPAYFLIRIMMDVGDMQRGAFTSQYLMMTIDGRPDNISYRALAFAPPEFRCAR